MITLLTQNILSDAITWIVASLGIVGLLRYRFKTAAPGALLLIATAYLVIGVGILPVLVTVAFISSAVLVGQTLYRLLKIEADANDSIPQALALGAAAYLLVWSVLIDYPVNQRWLHACLILAPLFIGGFKRGKAWIQSSAGCRTNLQNQLQRLPYWSYVLSLLIVSWILRYAFMPTIGHDDNVLHLRLWTELLHHGFFDYDLKNEIWSLAPNLVDTGHAVLSLVAGSDARSAINLVLGMILCFEVLRLLALSSAAAGIRLLILVLFVSTPLFAYQLTTLQTELMLAVLLVAGSNMALRLREWNDRAGFLALLAVGAMACETKLPGVFIAMSLVFMGLAQIALNKSQNIFKHPFFSWRIAFLFFGLMLLAALPYLRAYLVTGNPVFPLMNGLFKSPYFDPISFVDPRYVHGATLATYWDMFFNTAKYNETENYTAGIQYLVLAPIALLAMCIRGRQSPYLLLTIPVVFYGGFMFSQIQYLRYLFPVMPLLCVVCVSLVMLPAPWLSRAFIVITLLCIGFNLAKVPKVSWYMNTPLASVFTDLGKRVAESKIIPEKTINDFINKNLPGASVLYVNNPYGATLNGTPITVNWHAPDNYKAIRTLKTQEDLLQFFNVLQPELVVRSTEEGIKDWQKLSHSLIREHLADFGYPIFSQGNVILYRLTNQPISYTNAHNHNPQKNRVGVSNDAPYVLTGDNKPHVLDAFNTEGKRHLKYSVVLDCRNGSTTFNAQINWNAGGVYFRPVKCDNEITAFKESLPIPADATYGEISISARQVENRATVEYLNVSLN